MFIFFYRGKGILVVVYAIFSFVGMAIIFGALKRNIGGIFNSIGISGGMAVAALLSAFSSHSGDQLQ